MFMMVSVAHAASPKIGVVMAERLLKEAPQMEALNSDILKKFSGRKDELVDMEADIKKLQGEYKRNELVMTQDKLDELKNKIIGNLQVFKQKEASFNQDLTAVRNEKLGALQTQIRGIIKNIADKEDYDLILSDGVVHASGKIDITDKVISRMKKDFK